MPCVPANGGEPRTVLGDFRAPSPGSLAGLVPRRPRPPLPGQAPESAGREDWWVAPVDGGPAVATGAAKAWPPVDAAQVPCAWYGSHVLMAAGTTMEGVNLYLVRIGPDFRVSGPPEPLTSGTGVTFAASVSKDGRLFVPRWKGFAELWAVDPESSERPGPVQLTLDEAPKYAFNVDRDGARVFYTALLGPKGAAAGVPPARRRERPRDRSPAAAGAGTVHRAGPNPTRGQAPLVEQEVDGKIATFVGSADGPGRELWRDGRVVGFTADERRALLRVGPKSLVLRDVAGGPDQPVFDAGPAALVDADLSWDDRWLTVLTGHDDGTMAIRVVPLAARASTGVEIVRSDDWLGSPRWSPDGSRLYHLSRRDGFYCLWSQLLDALTKAPRGEPVAVVHAHRNPRIGPPRGSFSVSVGRSRLVFSAANVTGDILMAQLPPD